ncbi:MAG: ABC transporter ATP-binding protein [Alistipes sp.]|nr:ABC transporter ATP-binding protein [Alistipes sp.]MBR2975910.1 ABC transporter ATP-binding protein [Alistipes sp.]
MNAIEIHNLSKSYGKHKALDDISFDVRQGELFGLIGPDGAGKTTLFRLLTTLLRPSAGSATVDGHDIVKEYRAIRSCVGYMPGRFSLYGDLSVEENLNFFAAMFGVTVAESYDLIAPIYSQIEPFRKRRAGKLSGGMKQKLALSCALIHRPKVLLLDEPTTGVDAVSRSEFWDMLAGLKEHGITILVSTPYMDEASRCERIALCNEGRILGIDTPTNIVKAFDKRLYGVSARNMYSLLDRMRHTKGVVDCYPFGERHHMVVDEECDIEHLKMECTDIESFNIVSAEPTIEDMFIKLMKR